MAIKTYKPTTPSRRNMSVTDYSSLSKVAPERSLLQPLNKKSGRNSYGRITVRHRGGGNRKKYRVIDFKRNKFDVPAEVKSIEYDPNRSAHIALIQYEDGVKSYITAQLARSGGNGAQVMALEGPYALLRLPSGELRNVPCNCMATIGVVGNADHANVKIGKAGRKRNMGFRPTVRGSVMNPNDHPHGGGEGKSPIGRPGPCTPWGKPALGYKTRSKKKKSDKMIVRRRNGK